jgi:hypothetical protein
MHISWTACIIVAACHLHQAMPLQTNILPLPMVLGYWLHFLSTLMLTTTIVWSMVRSVVVLIGYHYQYQ